MVISIVRFMAEYYGISLDAGYKYSHKDIKRSFKFVKRCSFKYADSNREDVGKGKIIYVRDDFGTIYPCICPQKIAISNGTCEFTVTLKENGELDKDGLIEQLSELPTHVLHELLSKYKKKPSFYKIIKNELIARGEYDIKKYRLLKEITQIEEGDLDDKYQRRCQIKCKKP